MCDYNKFEMYQNIRILWSIICKVPSKASLKSSLNTIKYSVTAFEIISIK